MSPLDKKRFSHFIGINHHRFHNAQLVQASVISTVVAARAFDDPDNRDLRIVFFHDIAGALPSALLDEFRALGVETVNVPSTSNGHGLNDQIAMARNLKADFFYRVDADDTVAPDRFRLQAKLLENDRADVCGGGLTYVNTATGQTFDVIPAAQPGAWDYLTNCAMLHPTLAFRLDRLELCRVAYWDKRLEDKHLGLQIHRAKLRLLNDQHIYGRYNLVPEARKSFAIARLNLQLNWAFLVVSRQWHMLPTALALFVASSLLPSHPLRKLRQMMRRTPSRRITSDAGFGGGNGTAETAPRPPV